MKWDVERWISEEDSILEVWVLVPWILRLGIYSQTPKAISRARKLIK